MFSDKQKLNDNDDDDDDEEDEMMITITMRTKMVVSSTETKDVATKQQRNTNSSRFVSAGARRDVDRISGPLY